MVGNKNLYKLALKLGLDHKMASVKFSPWVNWRPPGHVRTLTLEKKLADLDDQLTVAAKQNGLKKRISAFDHMSEDVQTLNNYPIDQCLIDIILGGRRSLPCR
jgi:hypothetical protein